MEKIPNDALQENIAKDLEMKGDWSADYGDFAQSDIPQTPPIDEGLEPEEMEGPPDDFATEDDIDNENSLYVYGINDQVTIGVESFWVDENDMNPDHEALQRLGFQFLGPFAYAEIDNKTKMRNLISTLTKYSDQGDIHIPAIYWNDISSAHDAMMESQSKAEFLSQLSNMEMRNLYIQRTRKSRNPRTVNIGIVVERGRLYVMIDYSKNPRGRWLAKRKFKSLKWQVDEDGSYFAFFRKKGDARQFMKKVAKELTINNMDAALEELKELKIRKENLEKT